MDAREDAIRAVLRRQLGRDGGYTRLIADLLTTKSVAATLRAFGWEDASDALVFELQAILGQTAPALRALYCTVVSREYLPRALVLYNSLPAPKRFLFFCLDELAADALTVRGIPSAQIIRHANFGDPALRARRSPAEYAWTCKSLALQHLMQFRHREWDWLVYLDADMMAFGDIDAALATAADVLLTAHNFSPRFQHLAARGGPINAGYAAFRTTSAGQQLLATWAADCQAECSEAIVGDQRHLAKLLDRRGVDLAPADLNVGPWSLPRERPLLYHFQSLRLLPGNLVAAYMGGQRPPSLRIYPRYARLLRRAHEELAIPIPRTPLHSLLRPGLAGNILFSR